MQFAEFFLCSCGVVNAHSRWEAIHVAMVLAWTWWWVLLIFAVAGLGKECLHGCGDPLFLFPGHLCESIYCTLCSECVRPDHTAISTSVCGPSLSIFTVLMALSLILFWVRPHMLARNDARPTEVFKVLVYLHCRGKAQLNRMKWPGEI